MPVRLEPAASLSQVKHSNTEPLHSYTVFELLTSSQSSFRTQAFGSYHIGELSRLRRTYEYVQSYQSAHSLLSYTEYRIRGRHRPKIWPQAHLDTLAWGFKENFYAYAMWSVPKSDQLASQTLYHWIKNVINIRKVQNLKSFKHHTGQCKSTGGCYNELVVAYFGTGGGVKWLKRYTKSIPVDFMIYF